MDAHALQVTNRELEATVADLKRTVMQLEDRIDHEEAEARRLHHLVGDKNAEIDELKHVIHTQRREAVALREELDRHMASPAMVATPSLDSAGGRIDRSMQTLVDITPPEEVDRMHQQIEELQMQLEQFQAEMGATFGATCVRQSGFMDDGSDRGADSPDPEMASPEDEEFGNTYSPMRTAPRLQLNLAIPPNLGAGGGDPTSEALLTARGAGAQPGETPRAHIRIPQLVTTRGAAAGPAAPSPPACGASSVTTAPLTARRNASEPNFSFGHGHTPRISTADLMRRSYVDPTSTTGPSYIIGDVNYGTDSQSPKGASRRVSMSVLEPSQQQSHQARRAQSVVSVAAASSNASPPMPPTAARTVTDSGDDAPQHAAAQFRARHASVIGANSVCIGSISPDIGGLSINSASPRASGATTTIDVDVALSGGHMFGIADSGEPCPVCAMIESIQTTYAGKELTREAYYAVGWIPEICHRWSLEHNIAWTIEERAAVATALTNRTRLSAFTSFSHRGPVNIWRKRPFWRSAWRPAYAVLQGVFLYIFNSSRPNEPVVAVIPVRASFIELVTLNGRTRCLQISSLGCMSCVGAAPGDCVETMTIALDSQKELLGWEKALQTMQRTCAHKCSHKFMNELNALKDISEMLLTLAKHNEKRAAEKEKELLREKPAEEK